MRFFSTISQASRSNYRFKKSPATRTFKLVGKPQISGMVWDVSVKRPKKPNSGKRHVSKVKIIKLFRITRLTARLLGSDF
jgi:ribosomal protein S12